MLLKSGASINLSLMETSKVDWTNCTHPFDFITGWKLMRRIRETSDVQQDSYNGTEAQLRLVMTLNFFW